MNDVDVLDYYRLFLYICHVSNTQNERANRAIFDALPSFLGIIRLRPATPDTQKLLFITAFASAVILFIVLRRAQDGFKYDKKGSFDPLSELNHSIVQQRDVLRVPHSSDRLSLPHTIFLDE
jgi:hypothetical protein